MVKGESVFVIGFLTFLNWPKNTGFFYFVIANKIIVMPLKVRNYWASMECYFCIFMYKCAVKSRHKLNPPPSTPVCVHIRSITNPRILRFGDSHRNRRAFWQESRFPLDDLLILKINYKKQKNIILIYFKK